MYYNEYIRAVLHLFIFHRVIINYADQSAHSAVLAAGHFPVVIAGAGPTGLTLAAMLSRLGVRCLLLERAKGLPDHPQVRILEQNDF